MRAKTPTAAIGEVGSTSATAAAAIVAEPRATVHIRARVDCSPGVAAGAW